MMTDEQALATIPTEIDAYVSIDSIRIVSRHRRDLGDITSLAESIADLGLLNPITLAADSRLVAGERRLAACRQLGWDSVPARIVRNLSEASALLRAERDENTCRKDMLPSEKAALGAALEEIEAAHARERLHAAQEQGRATRYGLDSSGKGGVQARETAEVVGEVLGMSRSTYAELKFAHAAAVDPTATDEARDLGRRALADLDLGAGIQPTVAKLRAQLRGDESPTPAKKEARSATAPTRPQIAGAGAQRRALTGACTTLAGIAHGLRQIEDIHPDITSKEAAEWVGGLSEARLALERVIKRLKERTNNGV